MRIKLLYEYNGYSLFLFYKNAKKMLPEGSLKVSGRSAIENRGKESAALLRPPDA